MSDFLQDLERLRVHRNWSWTRIAAAYGTTERTVRRWAEGEEAPTGLSSPLELRYGTAFVVSDAQFPFHDEALHEVQTEIVRDLQPDQLIFAGDTIDFPQLSSFVHNPYKLQQAMDDVKACHLRYINPLTEAAPDSKWIWVDGNHEQRIQRYLERNAAAIEDYIDPRKFMNLSGFHEYFTYGRAVGYMLTPKLLVCHGWQARKHSAYTAKANLEDVGYRVSVLGAHTHRLGAYFHTGFDGEPVVSYEMGHSSDIERVPMAYAGGTPNWQSSAGAIVRYKLNGDSFVIELLPVLGPRGNRRVLVSATGKEYKLQDGSKRRH